MAHGLDIRRSSASVWGSLSGMRSVPTVSKYIDTTTCIGCKACEVACQEWNDLKPVATQQVGTYQTLPTLNPPHVTGGTVTLTWNGAGILQSTPTLSPTHWSDVNPQPGNNIFTAPVSGAPTYYRVRVPSPVTP